jgi:hypothetical protein
MYDAYAMSVVMKDDSSVGFLGIDQRGSWRMRKPISDLEFLAKFLKQAPPLSRLRGRMSSILLRRFRKNRFQQIVRQRQTCVDVWRSVIDDCRVLLRSQNGSANMEQLIVNMSPFRYCAADVVEKLSGQFI